MRFESATLPARPGTPNQDLIVSGPDVVVLLDGAGGPSEDGGGCLHGVHWYVRQLGSRLLGGLLTGREPLAELLARAIDSVASVHRSTCDLRHPGTPSSTVAMVRRSEDTFEYLALHDSTIVLSGSDGSRAVSDRRLQRIPELRSLWARRDQLRLGTDAHAVARRACIAAELDFRNTPAGYWVAGADPHSAAEAISATVPAADLRAVSLLSDGVADYVDAYRLATWPQVVEVLDRTGPAGLIRLVRAAERSDATGRRWPRFKVHDDASAAHWTVTPPVEVP